METHPANTRHHLKIMDIVLNTFLTNSVARRDAKMTTLTHLFDIFVNETNGSNTLYKTMSILTRLDSIHNINIGHYFHQGDERRSSNVAETHNSANSPDFVSIVQIITVKDRFVR